MKLMWKNVGVAMLEEMFLMKNELFAVKSENFEVVKMCRGKRTIRWKART